MDAAFLDRQEACLRLASLLGPSTKPLLAIRQSPGWPPREPDEDIRARLLATGLFSV